MVISGRLYFSDIFSSLDLLAIVPSSSTISTKRDAGFSPASFAKSIEASVCPALRPSVARLRDVRHLQLGDGVRLTGAARGGLRCQLLPQHDRAAAE